MSDKEIKCQLAKAALENGVGLNEVKEFYAWVMEGPDDSLDEEDDSYKSVSICEFAQDTKCQKTITNRCSEHNIKTVGELIKLGSSKFRQFPHVGYTTVRKISEELNKQFGVKRW